MPLNAAWPTSAAVKLRSEAGASCTQLIVQMAATHLLVRSQQEQVLSDEEFVVASRPLSIGAAGIEVIALAAATGESTSPMLTRVAMIHLVMCMRFILCLFDARFISLAY